MCSQRLSGRMGSSFEAEVESDSEVEELTAGGDIEDQELEGKGIEDEEYQDEDEVIFLR